MNFKFFEVNETITPYEGAGWDYYRPESLGGNYEIVTGHFIGIHSFLDQFRSDYIVPIISIVGPGNNVHDIHTYGNGQGWGFDITRDLIRITWGKLII